MISLALLLPSGTNPLEVPELQWSFGGSRNGKKQSSVGSGYQEKGKFMDGRILSAWKQQLWALCKGKERRNNSATENGTFPLVVTQGEGWNLISFGNSLHRSGGTVTFQGIWG